MSELQVFIFNYDKCGFFLFYIIKKDNNKIDSLREAWCVNMFYKVMLIIVGKNTRKKNDRQNKKYIKEDEERKLKRAME